MDGESWDCGRAALQREQNQVQREALSAQLSPCRGGRRLHPRRGLGDFKDLPSLWAEPRAPRGRREAAVVVDGVLEGVTPGPKRRACLDPGLAFSGLANPSPRRSPCQGSAL